MSHFPSLKTENDKKSNACFMVIYFISARKNLCRLQNGWIDPCAYFLYIKRQLRDHHGEQGEKSCTYMQK